MTKYDNIAERIQIIMDKFGMTKNEFAKKAGIEPSNFRKMMIGELRITSKTIYKICDHFGINRNWLENGDDDITPDIAPEISNSIPLVTEETDSGQPYYDVDFLGGFDILYNNQTIIPSGKVDIPTYNKPGVVWCNITGHSMEPAINHGDIIAIRELKDWQTYLPKGETYGIITSNGLRTVKIVRKGSDKDHVLLVPINTNGYDEEEIPINIIEKVFIVMANIKRF